MTQEDDHSKLAALRRRVGIAMQRGAITEAQHLAILRHSNKKEENEGVLSAISGLENTIQDIESGSWQ